MTDSRTQPRLLAVLILALFCSGLPGALAKVEPSDRPTVRKPIAQNESRNGKIANLVGKILEQIHYNQEPYNDKVATLHLQNYMEGLDYNHLIFLQSDADEFTAKYGRRLDELTAERDTSPAFEIFDRFTQRLEERKAVVDKLADQEFDFTVDESFQPDRSKMPYPETKAEADELWRKRIKYELLQSRLGKDDEKTARDRLKKRYRNLIKHIYEYEEQDILEAYLNGLTQAYDPHSDYLTPDEKENFDISAIKLKLTGIGAVLSTDEGYAKIQRLVPGGPAEGSKQLRPGDRISAVTQGDEGEPVDVVDMKLRKVVDLIRGERGSKVILTIIPANAVDSSVRKDVHIIRDEVNLADMHASAKIYEIPESTGTRKIGVIQMDSFYEETVSDVSKLIRSLKQEGIDGLVLDLRKNGGGLLNQAIDLTGLFVRQGPVVQIRTHDGEKTVLSDEDNGKVLYDGPLAVMVGHLSASASEIVAAALQDYDRALIIGDNATHGKGTVQTLLPLERWMGFGFRGDPGHLKLTVQKFYRISGGSTQERGVIPDIQLPSPLDYLEIGERTLPNHMPWDNMAPARFGSYNMVSKHLPELKKRSETRVDDSQDFAYIYEDIEVLQRRLEDKSVSLNEATRRKEKEDLLASKKTRKAEREARPEDPRTIYELTTEMATKGDAPKLFVAETAEVVDEEAPATADAKDAKPAEDKDKDAQVASKEDEDDSAGLLDPLNSSFDPQLDEALMIMLDYSDLLTNRGVLADRTPLATVPKPIARTTADTPAN